MSELEDLRNEVEHLRKQRDWLQESNTKTLERARAAEAIVKAYGQRTKIGTDRRIDVTTFFGRVGDVHHIGAEPHVPPVDSLCLAVSLLVEEAGETVLACFDPESGMSALIKAHLEQIQWAIKSTVKDDWQVDLPALADGCTDTDYVVEGIRIRCGIDGDPIWRLVHKANLTKADGPRDPVTNKVGKPPGFTPPDVRGELVRQGWRP